MVRLLGCALVALVVVAAPARAAERPFSPTSVWNAALSDRTPIDAKSSDYVNRLVRLVSVRGAYMNTTRYSTPVYTVPADQPAVPVTLDNTQSSLADAFAAVPIPGGARPAAGTDGNMVVWQPSTDTMWEFYRASLQPDGWHTVYGGRMTDVSTSPGFFAGANRRWGATATSLPLLGGLIRLDELEAGHIDHALAIALPEVKANVYSWPAQRTDGSSFHPNAIPEGARFRFSPGLDLDKLEMSPVVRMLAEAVQKYGMIVRDGGSNVAFYGEDPTPTGANPYLGEDGYYGGGYIDQLLTREFPWQRLRATATWLIRE
jgi:hypothetical protein